MEKQTDDIKVFSSISTTWGIPSNLFFGGLAIGVLLGIVLFPSAGFIFGLVFSISLTTVIITILMSLHRNDPQGLQAWVRRLKSPSNTWVGGHYKKKRLIIIR